MPLNVRSATQAPEDAASPRETQTWSLAHAGFLRAILLIVAYCSAVIFVDCNDRVSRNKCGSDHCRRTLHHRGRRDVSSAQLASRFAR